jgi:hypothetical protein
MTNNQNLEFGPMRSDEIDGLNGLLEQALTFTIGGMVPGQRRSAMSICAG